MKIRIGIALLAAFVSLTTGCASATGGITTRSVATAPGGLRLEQEAANIVRLTWRPKEGNVRINWTVDGRFEMPQYVDASAGKAVHTVPTSAKTVSAQVFFPTAIPVSVPEIALAR